MSKDTIVWDMDDTLCQFSYPAIKVAERVAGRKLTSDELTSGMWIHDVLPQEQANAVLKALDPTFYWQLLPTAVVDTWRSEAGKALRAKFSHHVATARQEVLGPMAMDITIAWLGKYGVKMDGVSITHPRDSKVQATPRSTKVFVEDSAKVATDALENGCMVFLLDRPWNRRIEPNEALIRICDERTLLARMAHILC